MQIRKVIERRIRYQGKGINAVGDVSAVISANVGTGSSRSHVSTRSWQHVVQRGGRTHVADEREPTRGGNDDDAAGGSPARD